MKIFALSILLLFTTLPSFSQKKTEEEIFTAVEQQAKFPGGMGAFGKKIQRSKVIANLAKGYAEKGVSTKIRIEFIVERDSTVSYVRLLSSLDLLEAESSFSNKFKKELTEKWIPAVIKNKSVRSKFTIPMNVCYSE